MCKITLYVQNYNLCVKLYTLFKIVYMCVKLELHNWCKLNAFLKLFVKLHILYNIKAVSFTYPLENFTLDWNFLHNQRLWWLWQISGMNWYQVSFNCNCNEFPRSDYRFQGKMVPDYNVTTTFQAFVGAKTSQHIWGINKPSLYGCSIMYY